MEDNSTVIQLKKALNQLLDAYENLKIESGKIKQENTKLKEDIQSLEVMNTGLNTKLSSLTSTTDNNSLEMGEMLDKIENILSSSTEEELQDLSRDDNDEDEKEEEEENIDNDSETIESKDEDSTGTSFSNNNDNNKDIDLGRMQSLLNGFNN